MAGGDGDRRPCVCSFVPNLRTLHVTILFQDLQAPAMATTKLSPSPSTATQQVPRYCHVAGPHPHEQPRGTSPGAASWQVPGHGHVAGPRPHTWSHCRSPGTATWQVPSPVHSRMAGPKGWPCMSLLLDMQGRSLSLGTATQHVPGPRHNMGGPHPQVWPPACPHPQARPPACPQL